MVPTVIETLDLASATTTQLARLRDLVANDGFCLVPGQRLGPVELDDLAVRFGSPLFTPGESPLPGHRYVFEVTNRGRTTTPRSVFHADTTYIPSPPAITALAAVEVPRQGGETLIIDQYATAACASGQLLADLDGVEVLHVASRVSSPDEAGSGAWHPALHRHPVTDRPALLLTARERLAGARRHRQRLHPDEEVALLDRLHRHATEAVAPYVHRWRSGDVLFIDNRCTLHAADHARVDGHRTLHRVMFGAAGP
ncbi:MAG: TauD/TfdA family dioxygenase [Actinomycetota bacterium]